MNEKAKNKLWEQYSAKQRKTQDGAPETPRSRASYSSQPKTSYKHEAKKCLGTTSPGGVLGARPLTFPRREAIKEQAVRERSEP